MKRQIILSIMVGLFLSGTLRAQSPAAVSAPVTLGPYEYETKPDHEAFRIFNPRKRRPRVRCCCRWGIGWPSAAIRSPNRKCTRGSSKPI